MDLQSIKEQLNSEREEQAKTGGITRSRRNRRKQRKRGEISSTSSANKQIEGHLPQVMAKLEEILEQQRAENPSRRPSWFPALEAHPVRLSALYALRNMFDGVGADWTLSNTVMHIAKSINASLLVHTLKNSGRDGRKALKDLEERVAEREGSARSRRDYAMWLAGRKKKKQKLTRRGKPVLDADGNNIFVDDNTKYHWQSFDEWDWNTKVKLGQVLMTCVFASTDIFDKEQVQDKIDYNKPFQKKPYKLKFTRSFMRRMTKDNFKFDETTPQFGPMYIPPYDWNEHSSGPYKDISLALLVPLVKHASPQQEEAMMKAMINGELEEPLRAINSLQSVPYDVNEYVVDAVNWVYDNHLELGTKVNSYPNFIEADELPNIPKDEFNTWPAEDRYIYGEDQIAIVKQNREVTANHQAMLRHLNEAEAILEAKDEHGVTGFFLPHQFDTRGRLYHTCEFGHHNSDYLRAMFMFANKSAIREDNIAFLALMLANHYGIDKETLADRLAWAEENAVKIALAGEDFEAHFDFWREADDPFQFLAACHEWSNYLKHEGDEPYMTGLPISLDATQSGIQIYAAMNRNKVDGNKVNLTANEKPGDLYTEVMLEAQRLIQQDIDTLSVLDLSRDEDDDEETAIQKAKDRNKLNCANQWKAFGLTRKIVKRNAMTWAYSSRRYGFSEQLNTDLMEPLRKKVSRGELKEHPFGRDNGDRAAWYLAGINERAIETIVQSARGGMDFMQRIVNQLTGEGKHFKYNTPLNFPVHQYYRNPKLDNKRIECWGWDRDLMVIDKEAKLNFVEYDDTIHVSDSRLGVAPNFIHCLDATLLMKAVNLCNDLGVKDIMTVHDSFSTTIEHADTMSKAIRSAFVDLFENHDPYQEVLEQTRDRLDDNSNLPQPPDRASGEDALDITEVIKSDYAFS